MKNFLPILLLCACNLYAGGNKELMERAEARLRDINEQVLRLVSTEAIPANGQIQLKAYIQNIDSELIITDINLSTTGANTIRDEALELQSTKERISEPTTVGGNFELMEAAEARLSDINQILLDHVGKGEIPANGRIQLNATVKNTKPDLTITNLKVTTIESKPTTEGKLPDESTL